MADKLNKQKKKLKKDLKAIRKQLKKLEDKKNRFIRKEVKVEKKLQRIREKKAGIQKQIDAKLHQIETAATKISAFKDKVIHSNQPQISAEMTAAEAIQVIQDMSSKKEVNDFVGEDTRITVRRAADNKIADL